MVPSFSRGRGVALIVRACVGEEEGEGEEEGAESEAGAESKAEAESESEAEAESKAGRDGTASTAAPNCGTESGTELRQRRHGETADCGTGPPQRRDRPTGHTDSI